MTARDARRIRALLPVFGLTAFLWPVVCLASDPAYAAYLATECITCHQMNGRPTAAIPSIVALPESEFVASMRAYQTGERSNEVMRTVVARLTPEDLEELASYFASM
jgi:cytochrome c